MVSTRRLLLKIALLVIAIVLFLVGLMISYGML